MITSQLTELQTLNRELAAYDANLTVEQQGNEPAEITAKRNRAISLAWAQLRNAGLQGTWFGLTSKAGL